MESFFQHVTRFCFGASYAVALVLELIQLLRPSKVLRWTGLAFGTAGLLAHTLFLAFQRPQVAAPSGSLLLLSWVVAVFYVYGSFHHRKQAWALFVVPVVLTLVVLSALYPATADDS